MIRKSLTVAALATVALASAAHAQSGRDQIRFVGSSTVYPFSTSVAEQFGKTTSFKTPVVESTGTGGGMKLFCAGVGVDHPDLTNASRRMKKSELEMCEKNGVKNVVEIKVGYDGIVFANAKKAGAPVQFTREQIFLAVAKDVPVDGKLVANPYVKWSDIDASLPKTDIEVLGPPPTSGTRDAFVELVMEEACDKFPEIKALKGDKKAHGAACKTVREDGAFIEAGENDNLIVQKLDSNPKAFGIFGFSFLDQNSDKLQGSVVDAQAPTFDNIASGSYPVSRPLFIYAKGEHAGVIPGMKEFIAEYTSEKAWGPDGYLSLKGLIPMPDAERKDWNMKANSLAKIQM